MPAQESMQSALENVVSTIFDGSNEIAGGHSEAQLELCRIFEGLLQQLLSLKWTEPALVEDPSTSSARCGRLQICTSFIRIAKTADTSDRLAPLYIANTISTAFQKRKP
ncbi:protein HASTY 1 [Pyrus ussuriensis x Pyrus communis]|uniref:Protein HASTY 1 n=1 Tax=Pyrus ussuriensis x Pyrus communis TaxID=2448454 RepID=A0A5N5HPE8_9ROSA|nr:protein HASTY 1 [Pyrus ussuriensis x Pyrus communis]